MQMNMPGHGRFSMSAACVNVDAIWKEAGFEVSCSILMTFLAQQIGPCAPPCVICLSGLALMDAVVVMPIRILMQGSSEAPLFCGRVQPVLFAEGDAIEQAKSMPYMCEIAQTSVFAHRCWKAMAGKERQWFCCKKACLVATDCSKCRAPAQGISLHVLLASLVCCHPLRQCALILPRPRHTDGRERLV